MANIYTIRAFALDILALVGETPDAALTEINKLKDQLSKAFALMVCNIAHGGSEHDPIQGVDDDFTMFAKWAYWGNGVDISLHSMPIGKVGYHTDNDKPIYSEHLPFYPEGWNYDLVDREGDTLYATTYERMAAPIETLYEGWKY